MIKHQNDLLELLKNEEWDTGHAFALSGLSFSIQLNRGGAIIVLNGFRSSK